MPRKFHLVRSPEEPIHAHIEFVCNYSQPINVEGSYTRKVQIHRSDAERIGTLLAVAAGLCKVLAENREIGMHCSSPEPEIKFYLLVEARIFLYSTI
jgi:hypothetical protein